MGEQKDPPHSLLGETEGEGRAVGESWQGGGPCLNPLLWWEQKNLSLKIPKMEKSCVRKRTTE